MDGETRPYSIRMLLVDGIPDGLKLVEKSNWTGQGIMCSRARFGSAKIRPEFNRTGVYLLIGSETDDLPAIYIGEGDPVKPRLDCHNANKDFWTKLVMFTSKDQNLNKAHVQHLEARLIELAAEAKRCVLENKNAPALPTLSESDCADVDGFLKEMLLIFPILGVSIFEKPATPNSQEIMLLLKSKGVIARGYESANGFVVMKSSEAVLEAVPSIHNYMRTLRGHLIDQGLLVLADGRYVLSQDYIFNSPSTAAGILLGRPANGRVEWKDERGKTLKDYQLEECCLSARSFPD